MLALSSVQESGDIGLQGKQQAEEEDGKYYVCSPSLLSHATNSGSVWHTASVFSHVVLLCDDQTNPRSALSHGDTDPFKFRWLIPLSELQVRLGNTAGKKLPRYPS